MEGSPGAHRPLTADADERFLPALVAWEITRSCVLSCAHCRAAAHRGPYEGELSTGECYRVLDEIASVSKPILILTGGEPLLRPDVFDIARRGTALGLRVVLATCGSVVTAENAREMRESGIRRVSVSLDGGGAEFHDAFRGIAHLREAGVEFQVNTTVTRRNAGQLGEIMDLAVRLGASAFHPFLLVPTGRGKELEGDELSPAQYEEVLGWVWERSQSAPIHVKPTCAPHYHRIMRQKGPSGGRPAAPRHGLHSLTRGCMGGCSFCFISHVGDVQICGFLDMTAGNVRRESFSDIWRDSAFLLSLRDFDGYHGKCGYCEYRKVCGGCRARAYAVTGDYLAEEPFCTYVPSRAPSP
jgi:heme b synthase